MLLLKTAVLASASGRVLLFVRVADAVAALFTAV